MTVEFALVSVVFFAFIFGMIEFSRLNIIRHAADNAAYEAARIGVVPGATVAEVEAIAQQHLDILRVTDSVITVSPNPLDIDSDDVTVTVTIPVAPNSWMVPKFANGATIQSSVTLGTERYRGVPAGGGP